MERATTSSEVMRLYDRLRECIRANNLRGVEETYRELAQAGRPLAEIMREGGLTSDDLKGMKPDAGQSRAYHWARQWSVRPNLASRALELPSPSRDVASAPEIRTQNPSPAILASAPEMPAASRRDWVEEWHARQQLARPESAIDPEPSLTIDHAGTLSEDLTYSHTADPDGDQPQLAEQDTTQNAHFSAMRLRRIGLYSGTAVLVAVSLFLVLHLGKRPLGTSSSEDSEQSQPALIGDTAPGADLNDRTAATQPVTPIATRTTASEIQAIPSLPPAEPNVHTSEATIAEAAPASKPAEVPPIIDQHAPTNTAADLASSEPKPTSTSVTEPSQPPNGAPSIVVDTQAQTSAESNQVSAPMQSSSQGVPTITAPNETLPEAATVTKVLPPALKGNRTTTIATQALVERGDMLFGTGDIVSARLYYERAVDAGSAEAALRLGETFDPSFLARARLNGMRGDPAVAVKWYKRARELGSMEADILVMSIETK